MFLLVPYPLRLKAEAQSWQWKSAWQCCDLYCQLSAELFTSQNAELQGDMVKIISEFPAVAAKTWCIFFSKGKKKPWPKAEALRSTF